MIDTIRIDSPYMEDTVIITIENKLIRRLAIDMKTGEEMFSFTCDELPGGTLPAMYRAREIKNRLTGAASPFLYSVNSSC